jgi:hypothetical protein
MGHQGIPGFVNFAKSGLSSPIYANSRPMPKILVLHGTRLNLLGRGVDAAKSSEIAWIIVDPAAFAHTSVAPGCAGMTGL